MRGSWRATVLVGMTALTASGAGSAQEAPEPLGPDLSVERIAEGVWRHVSYFDMPEFGRVPANGLVVVDQGEAAVIDTPWTDEQMRLLGDWISRRRSARLVLVIPTHSHRDCMGGLAAAHSLGAESHASTSTVSIARERGLELPRNGFSGEARLKVGSRELRPRFVGPGHTVDNIVVWIPDAKVLFGGCLVRASSHRTLGYTKEADVAAWPRTIETLLKEYAEAVIVVPGHGDPGGLELPHHTLDLLRGPLK